MWTMKWLLIMTKSCGLKFFSSEEASRMWGKLQPTRTWMNFQKLPHCIKPTLSVINILCMKGTDVMTVCVMVCFGVIKFHVELLEVTHWFSLSLDKQQGELVVQPYSLTASRTLLLYTRSYSRNISSSMICEDPNSVGCKFLLLNQ